VVDLGKGATHIEVVERGFRHEHRLHAAIDFSQVFAARRVLRGEFFDLHYRSRNSKPGPEPISARIGLVIAKKLVSRAVQRNLLKRLARETFRHGRQELPPYDLVLRLAKPPGRTQDWAARRAWCADIEDLLVRLPQ